MNMRSIKPHVVDDRFKESNLAYWLTDFSSWSKDRFAGEVREAMVSAYGLEVAFDENLVTILTDQMNTYVLATQTLAVEPLIELANNGARMANPNQKIRDTSLSRIIQIMTTMGLLPSGRPKRSNAPTEIDDILAGPKAA
jgi:phage terminase small subunit